jgi:hypothetical protein
MRILLTASVGIVVLALVVGMIALVVSVGAKLDDRRTRRKRA